MVMQMKKLISFFIILGICTLFCFVYRTHTYASQPNTFYRVYLDGQTIGVVSSKTELEEYIDKKNKKYKQQYGVKTVYAPNGLDIEKEVTYDGSIDQVENVYSKIQNKKPFTVEGYQFKIDNTAEESEEKEIINIYVIKKETFDEAVESLYASFVGKETYKNYLAKTQKEIKDVGSYLNSIYIDNDITIKKVRIPVDEKIYSESDELAQYLLFGENQEKKEYIVQNGDNIETVSFDNKISIEEFLLSNPTFTNERNLLFPGQKVLIGVTDPKVRVVTEEAITEDVTKKYDTIIKYDSSKVKGDNEVVQEGVDGLERVSQIVKKVNGSISYIKPVGKEELKPSVSKIVVYGQKEIANVGATSSWKWPTNSGYRLSSHYGWRSDPFTGRRSFHSGLDISGTGYGSNIYASNNGTVQAAGLRGDYGYYVVINHNNGYSSLYGHMSRIASGIKVGMTVARGQVIGYVGQTGQATGPHLHFEIWKGVPFTGSRLNPLKYL